MGCVIYFLRVMISLIFEDCRRSPFFRSSVRFVVFIRKKQPDNFWILILLLLFVRPFLVEFVMRRVGKSDKLTQEVVFHLYLTLRHPMSFVLHVVSSLYYTCGSLSVPSRSCLDLLLSTLWFICLPKPSSSDLRLLLPPHSLPV